MRRSRDDGFTLVEVLIVCTVISVLSAIGGPVFLRQRERGWQATLRSDLRNAAAANEAWLTGHGTYVAPGPTALDDLETEGFAPSPSVLLSVVDDAMELGGGGFCLRGVHSSLGPARALYFASSGPDAGRPTQAPCAAS